MDRRSYRPKPTIITDIDNADNVALSTEEISQVQEILSRVETETDNIG